MFGYNTAENCKTAQTNMVGANGCPKDEFCTATGASCKYTSVTRAGPDIQCSSDADCTDDKFNQKQCCSAYKTLYTAGCGGDSAKADQVAKDAKTAGYCDDSDKCIPLPTPSASSSITPNNMAALAVSAVCALVMAAAT